MKHRKIKLQIICITFSRVQAGAYALMLAPENEETRRLPIMIGTPEAQSIAIFLEQLRPPRPLTHDLFVSLAQTLNVKVKEVFIYKYEDGIFYSELVFNDKNGKEIRLDSRASDSIAIGIRSNADIFVDEKIMKEVSIEMGEGEIYDESSNNSQKTDLAIDQMNLDELKRVLKEAIAIENYEKASYIRDLINKRK